MLNTKDEAITRISALLSYIVNTKALISKMMDRLTSGPFADRDQSSHSEDQITSVGLLHYNKCSPGRTTIHFWKVSQYDYTKEVLVVITTLDQLSASWISGLHSSTFTI